jgi:hypothetical protein
VATSTFAGPPAIGVELFARARNGTLGCAQYINNRRTNHSEESTKKVRLLMSRRTRSISPDVEEPAVLRALYVRAVEAWSRTGSNHASSGHVELSDSDMYDMMEENEVDALAGPVWRGQTLVTLCLPNLPTLISVPCLGWSYL